MSHEMFVDVDLFHILHMTHWKFRKFRPLTWKKRLESGRILLKLRKLGRTFYAPGYLIWLDITITQWGPPLRLIRQ